MDPNGYQTPSPAPTPPQQTNPYAFLYEAPKKQSPLPNFAGGSKIKRLVVVLVGLAVLVVLALGFKAILGTSSPVDSGSLYSVLGEQVELIGLANTATQDTQNQQYLNLTFTILGSVTNDKHALVTLLTQNGIKLDPKQLVLQPNADKQLAQAQQTASFDTTYIPVMKQQLELYQQDLANAYTKNKSTLLKKYLKTDYANSVLLLKMLGSTSG